MYGGATPASGATAAMAFSSQSVMTLAYAGAAALTASQAPTTAAEADRLIVYVEAGMFPSLVLALVTIQRTRANRRESPSINRASLPLGEIDQQRRPPPPRRRADMTELARAVGAKLVLGCSSCGLLQLQIAARPARARGKATA